MFFRLMILLSLISCVSDKKSEHATVSVSIGNIVNLVSLTGRIEASQQATIMAPDDLTVLSLSVSSGQLVREGDVLCKLDPSKALEAVHVEQQRLYQIENQIKTSLIRLGGLKGDIEKTRRLYKVGAVSLDDKEKQEQELRIQSTQFEAQEQEKRNIQNQIEKLKKQAELLEIKAPFTGILNYIWISKDSFISGSSVKKGDLLFKISSQGKMMVKTTLREQDIQYFSQGQKLKVKFPSLGDTETEGIVKLVDNVATVDKDSGVASFRIQVEFTPPENVKSGMEATIDYIIESKEGVLLIPRSALNPMSGEKVEVMTIAGDQKVKKQIRVGLQDDVYVEVLEGLTQNEKVLVVYEE